MNAILRRFFEENRRLLMGMALVLVGNVVFYLVLSGPNQLRARLLRSDLEAAEEDARVALREYGVQLLEGKLLRGADERMHGLYAETFQTRGERYATVDAKIKEIAEKFKLEPHAIANEYSPLVAERLEELGVSFNLKGSYGSLRKFVSEVEQARDAEGNDLFFTIEKVALFDSTEIGAELNLNIRVSTYFHKPELAGQEKGIPREKPARRK